MFEFIDIDKWKRKTPYLNFIKYSNPIFSISTRLDVTELYASCKKRGTSFFSDFTFLAVKCLNEVEELRLRIVDGRVALYDVVDANYIVLNYDGVITTCRTKLSDSYSDFYARCRQDIESARKNKGTDVFNTRDNGVFYISAMRWLDLNSMTNPYDYADAESSSIPRITWGKIVEENGRLKMMFDIAAHHALVDGEPVCRGINLIQCALCDANGFLERTNK